ARTSQARTRTVVGRGAGGRAVAAIGRPAAAPAAAVQARGDDRAGDAHGRRVARLTVWAVENSCRIHRLGWRQLHGGSPTSSRIMLGFTGKSAGSAQLRESISWMPAPAKHPFAQQFLVVGLRVRR